MQYRLIIFDLDNTLAAPESGDTFRQPGERYVWKACVKDRLLDLWAEGVAIAVATNQGGIAAGKILYDETHQAIAALLRDLPFFVPFLLCPYVGTYPNSDKWRAFASWRKPSPVMALMLAAQYPNIPQAQVLIVGDRSEDQYSAWNAGFDYQDASVFFLPPGETLDIPF